MGALSAMRLAGETCVTAVVDQLAFDRPVPAGDTVVIQSYAYDSGHTSVKVRLQAYREDPLSGEREATTESYFVFVAIDEDGRPTAVPDLEITSDRCRELRDRALAGEDRG